MFVVMTSDPVPMVTLMSSPFAIRLPSRGKVVPSIPLLVRLSSTLAFAARIFLAHLREDA